MPEGVVDDAHMEESNDTEDSCEDKTVFIPMRMEQLTREHEMHFYTGLNGTAAFKTSLTSSSKKRQINELCLKHRK